MTNRASPSFKDFIKALDTLSSHKSCLLCKHYNPNTPIKLNSPSDNSIFKYADGSCSHKNIKCIQPYSWWKVFYHGPNIDKMDLTNMTKCNGKYFTPGGKINSIYNKYKDDYIE